MYKSYKEPIDYLFIFLIFIFIAFLSIAIPYTIYGKYMEAQRLKNDPEYKFQHSSIDHGDIRYHFKDDNTLEIYKRYAEIETSLIYNAALKMPMPVTRSKYKYKLIKVIHFTIDD